MIVWVCTLIKSRSTLKRRPPPSAAVHAIFGYIWKLPLIMHIDHTRKARHKHDNASRFASESVPQQSVAAKMLALLRLSLNTLTLARERLACVYSVNAWRSLAFRMCLWMVCNITHIRLMDQPPAAHRNSPRCLCGWCCSGFKENVFRLCIALIGGRDLFTLMRWL